MHVSYMRDKYGLATAANSETEILRTPVSNCTIWERLEVKPCSHLKESVARDKRRQKLQREIAALENKLSREKRFNLQVAQSGELKRLKKELEDI